MIGRAARARVVLAEAATLAVDLADLIAAARPAAGQVPTVAAFIETIVPTFTPRTAATYRPYWRLAVERLGDRRVDEVSLNDVAAVVADAVDRAKRKRPTTTGRAPRRPASPHCAPCSPAPPPAGCEPATPPPPSQPRRARSRRRALDDHELAELISAVRTTSRDPDLDLLVIRFHLESGARREGALNLRRHDLDLTRATVWLHEKGDTEREQPVSPSLLALLAGHLADRVPSSQHDEAVFRTSNGAPMSARRYDTIFCRARAALSWSDRVPVSAHVLRHTAITAVGRLAGYPVARAFAGHSPPTVTGRYLHAGLAEVATAVASLTGERHPLANGQYGHANAPWCSHRRRI